MLVVLLFLFCALARGDFLKYKFYTDTTCSSSPVAVQDTYFSELCSTSGFKLTCINSTFYTANSYGTDSSCTIPNYPPSIQMVQYPTCSQNDQGIGRAATTECISGAYTKPTTGVVLAFLPDSKSCAAFPQTVVQYTIVGACFDGIGTTGTILTCEKDAIRGRKYSDASCLGSVIEDSPVSYGCDLVNRTIADCYSSTPPAAAATTSKTPIIIGGAVGGTFAVVALVGAGIYFFRMPRGTAREAIPLL